MGRCSPFIALWTFAPVAADESESFIESRGKCLVEIGGCNDCHTSGFGVSGGTTPESEWLLGGSMGFRGAWGTTYAANLRAYIAGLTEDQWVTVSRSLVTRPPLPWWALNAMASDDLRAIYRYIKSLDPVDSEVPSYLPPDQIPDTPYMQWPSE